MLKPLALLVSTSATILLASAATAQDMTPDSIDVVEVASSTENFETFLNAVGEAELAETIATTPDLTVFAPIDTAFEGVEDLDAILADRAMLKGILELHVVPSIYMTGDIPDGETQVETLGGEIITISNKDGQISVTTPSGIEAMVVQADIEADNGVIHAINTVLTP